MEIIMETSLFNITCLSFKKYILKMPFWLTISVSWTFVFSNLVNRTLCKYYYTAILSLYLSLVLINSPFFSHFYLR